MNKREKEMRLRSHWNWMMRYHLFNEDKTYEENLNMFLKRHCANPPKSEDVNVLKKHYLEVLRNKVRMGMLSKEDEQNIRIYKL